MPDGFEIKDPAERKQLDPKLADLKIVPRKTNEPFLIEEEEDDDADAEEL